MLSADVSNWVTRPPVYVRCGQGCPDNPAGQDGFVCKEIGIVELIVSIDLVALLDVDEIERCANTAFTVRIEHDTDPKRSCPLGPETRRSAGDRGEPRSHRHVAAPRVLKQDGRRPGRLKIVLRRWGQDPGRDIGADQQIARRKRAEACCKRGCGPVRLVLDRERVTRADQAGLGDGGSDLVIAHGQREFEPAKRREAPFPRNEGGAHLPIQRRDG